MPENDFIASIGFVPDSSSLKRIEAAVSNSISQGTAKGAQKGLIQGINSNAFTQPLGRITGKANEFEKSMAAANARVIAFGASTAPIFAVATAFHKLVDSTVEVEKVMTGINAIFELSSSGLRKMTSQLFEVANKTGQTFGLASEAMTEFARQGLTVEEALSRTSAALILNKISGLNMAEAVSSITSILNGFSKEALNATDIIARMTAVDTQFAVSAADLSEALKRVGASANDANVSFSQTLALVTAARQITGREGSVIGNSFKTMFTRLQRPEVLDDLEEAGIQVRDLTGKTKPLIEVFKNLASTYQGLAQSQKSFVSEAVGGVYQINILKGIMRDLSSGMSVYDNAVLAADNSTSAVTKRMQTLNSTLSAGLVRTMNDLSLAASGVGEHLFGDSMRSGIGFFDSTFKMVAEGTNKDNKGIMAQATQGTLKGFGNFLVGPGLQMGLNLIMKLLVELAKFTKASGKDILGLDKTMKEKEALEQRFFQILSKEPAIMDQIINKQKTLSSLIAETVAVSISENKQNDLTKQVAGIIASQTVGKGLYHSPNLSGNGFIPNLSPVQSEMRMAAQGGYMAGRVISTQIQNGNHRLQSIANTNETKSQIASDGKQYEFINPPYGSTAGKAHERESIAKTGINPYSLAQMPLSANGFVPDQNTKDHSEYLKWQNIMKEEMDAKRFSSKRFVEAWQQSEAIKNRPLNNKEGNAKGYISGDNFLLKQKKRFEIFNEEQTIRNKKYNLKESHRYNKNFDRNNNTIDSIIAQIGSGSGFIPNLANLSQSELRALLMSKKFQSFTYQKSDGSIGTYHSSQWGVRKDKLVGASAPSGYKSWGDFDSGTGTLALHTIKSGEDEAKFRRFILANIKEVNANGQKYNFSANGYVPLLDALNRENLATGGHATVSHDSRLISPENPFGLAAIDGRTQRSANHAIAQHLSNGQSIQDVKKAHTAKGFVPNLALDSGFNASLMITLLGSVVKETHARENIEKLVSLFPALFDVTQKEILAKRRLVREFDEMNKNLLTTGKPQNFYGQTFGSIKELDNSKLNDKIGQLREEIKLGDDKIAASRESSNKLGFKIANISSFGGAYLSQALGSYVSPSAGAAVDDFSTSLTSAGQSLIAFPDKIGKALSAGFLINGILNFSDTLMKGSENLRAATDTQLTQIKNITENLQALSQSSANLSNLYLDAGTSVETISRESKKFSDTLGTLSQISGGQVLARKILAAPDSDSRQAAIQNAAIEIGKKGETIASLQNLRDLLEPKKFLGMNHLPFAQQDEGFTYRNYFDKDTVKQQIIENAGVPLANMSKDFQDALINSIESIDSFKNTLNNFNGSGAEGIRDYLKEVRKETGDIGYGQIIQQMRAILTQRNIFERNPEIQEVLKSSRTKASNSQLDVDTAIKTQQYARRLFLNQGAMASEGILNIRQYNTRTAYQSEATRLSGLEAQSSLFSQTHGDRTVAQREYNINLQKNALETRNSLNGLNIDTNRTLINSLSQDFDKVLKATDLKENITGEKNLGISENKALLISSINTGLTNVLKGSGSDIISRFSKNGQFDFQAFAKTAAQSGSNNPIIQSRVEKYLNSQQSVDILKTLNSSSNKQAEILQDFKTKSIEESQKLNAAIAEADFKKFNNYFGGIQTLLDRGSARTLMREMSRGMSMMNSRSPEARAQGAAMVLKSMQSQGFVMSDENALVRKAHQVFLESGAKTYQKYTGRILGLSNNQFGVNSSESIGLKQGYAQDLTKVLEAQYAGAFKPEGIKNNQGEFVNTVEYIKPFNDGLQTATNSLMNFPNALNFSAENLQKVTSDIQSAREENAAIVKDINITLDNEFKKLFEKYGEAAKGIEPKQQSDSTGFMRSAIAPIVTLIGQAVGLALINKGAGSLKTIFSKNVKSLEQTRGISSTVATNGNEFPIEMSSSSSGYKSYGEQGVSFNKGIGVSKDLSTKNTSWENTLNQNKSLRMRVNIPNQTPNSILSDIGQPSELSSVGVKPQIRPILIRQATYRIKGQLASLDKYINNLSLEYETKLNKVAQQIHLGQTADLQSIDASREITGLSNWKGLGKSTILKRLSEMGISTKSYIAPIEKVLRENELARNSQILNNFNQINETYSANRAQSVQSSMAEKARTPANLLRQDLLRKSIEQKQFQAWQRTIASNNARMNTSEFIPGTTMANGESSVPLNLSGRNSGLEKYFRELGMGTSGRGSMSAGISQKLATAQGQELLSNIRGLGTSVSYFAKGGINALASSRIGYTGMGVNPMVNPFSISGFRQASKLGKGLRGIGVLGAAFSASEAYSDYKNASNGNGSYIGATGNLANNIAAFAGPVGLGGSLINRYTVNKVNQYEDYQNQILDAKGQGEFLDRQRMALPRLQAQKRARTERLIQIQSQTKDQEQNILSENMGNDENFTQGNAKLAYHKLQNELSYAKGKNGVIDFKKLSPEALKTWSDVTRSQYQDVSVQKRGIVDYDVNNKPIYGRVFGGMKRQNITADQAQKLAQSIEKDYDVNKNPYLRGLTNERSKYLPTALNARSYTDSDGKVHQRTIQGTLDRSDYIGIAKNETNGKLQEMVNILKELAQQGVNDKNVNALEQQVNFSALPININVNNTGGLTPENKASIDAIVDTLAQSLQELTQRVTKLDGNVKPSKV